MTYDQNSTPIDTDSSLTTAELLFQTASTVTVMDNVMIGAGEITTAWNKSVAAFIETGLLLLKWKKKLSGSSKWLKLFDNNIGNLPFGVDTAERLMRIARNRVLTDSANWRNLPPSIRTLEVLTKAAPKKLEEWLADGKTVTADTQLKDAEKLIGKKSAKAKKNADETSDITESSTSDSDTATGEFTDDTSTDNDTTTASNDSNAVLKAYEHILALACDAQSDWTGITSEMVGALNEEMAARMIDNADRVLRNKRWEAAQPQQLQLEAAEVE
jgi:hypothetical protein